MKKLLLLIISIFIIASCVKGQGLPVWPLAVESTGNAQKVDWRTVNPSVQGIPNTAPSEHGGPGAAFDNCGELVFYVLHSGVANTPNNLYIYDANGNPILTNSTANAPGLNGKRGDHELNVVKVPTQANRWYIIYSQWKTDAGSPANNGDYEPAEVLYSLVEYSGGILNVIQRNIPLAVGPNSYTYTNGKAVSRTAANLNEHYLYLCRRSINNNNISLDRFIISSTGIDFDVNTGDVQATWWYLTIIGSPIELSPTEDRIAVVNRNQSSNYDDIIIFDAQVFSNASNAYQTISLGELILQADGIVNFTSQSVIQTAQTNSNLAFLANMERKVADIEFSPNGRFLYFTKGGYGASSYTNTTYLGQIDLGIISQPATYPYDVRLQVQVPPGPFNQSTGVGGANTPYLSQWNGITKIQSSYDGNLYFSKLNSNTIFVIPNPDQSLIQQLVPGTIDLSTTFEPNVIINGNGIHFPDQIDGWDYIHSSFVVVDLGNDTAFCDTNSYILNASNPNAESYLWQDNSTNSTFITNQSGLYYVEVVDSNNCVTSDSIFLEFNIPPHINLGNDTSLCKGEEIILNAYDSTAISYLWNDNSILSSLLISNTGYYSVSITDIHSCIAIDTIYIQFSGPIANYSLNPNTAEINQIVQFNDASIGANSWDWDFGDGQTAIGLDPTHMYSAPDTYDTWLYVEDSQACRDSFSVRLIIHQLFSFYIPNSFSPNNDGINDVFIPRGINIDEDRYIMQVYDRWGNSVFETKDINEGWDGSINGHKIKEENIISNVFSYYFYIVEKYTDIDHEYRGSIILIK